MAEYTTLAAVDLGSNSFHCQIARVDGEQLYPLDALREAVQIGAGLTHDKHLDEAAQARALACLQRFGERLRNFAPNEVRALGTNTLRVAKNTAAFLKKAEAALGFPIEVIADAKRRGSFIWASRIACPPPTSAGWSSISAAARPNLSSAPVTARSVWTVSTWAACHTADSSSATAR